MSAGDIDTPTRRAPSLIGLDEYGVHSSAAAHKPETPSMRASFGDTSLGRNQNLRLSDRATICNHLHAFWTKLKN